MRTAPKCIAIVGLGLMGGSLAAACRKKFRTSRMVGISRSRRALAVARRARWIHEGTSDLAVGVRCADLIILCTPVDTFPRLLSTLDRFAKKGALVTDTGSVKGAILREVDRRPWKKINFVGAHPMTGSHERGIGAAKPDLYDQGFTFLVRSRRTDPASFRAVKNFWKKITPKVVEVKAKEHDRIVAAISHLPHAVAACLVLSAGKKSISLASSGFLDTTRIAQGDPSIWFPIFQWNREALRKSFADFENRLRKFQRALAPGRTGLLRRILAEAARKRRQI